MLSNTIISKIKTLAKVSGILLGIGGLIYASNGLASTATYVTLTTVSASVDNTVSKLATIFIDLALITGIGFILGSFFKFHQHRQNPTQVQMSQGVSLLLIGCGLTLIPLLIPTTSVAVLGTQAAKPAQIGGADIKNLIGSGST